MNNDLTEILKDTPTVGDAPTRAEYLRHLQNHNLILSEMDFTQRPDIVKAVYKHWQTCRVVGCVFAQQIAARPDQHSIDWNVITDEVTTRNAIDVARQIAGYVEPLKNQEEAAVILLPGLCEPVALASLCKSLGQLEGWGCKAELNPSDKCDRVYVRLVVALPPTAEAELLGLAPFSFLPATRQAPVAALQIRTKPDRAEWRGPSPIKKAHLAHIDWPDEHTRDRYWERTEQNRRDILGGDDSAAKARVTFAIPQHHWDRADI